MQKNTKYGKLNEAKTTVGEYAPFVLIVDGTAIFTPTADDYHAAGWKTLNNMSYPTEPAPTGYHYEEDGFDETDTDITKKWKTVADPTVYRKFSKLKIETYLLQKGKLDELDAFLDNICIEGTNYALRRFYDQANDLAEDHPMFENYKNAAASALGMTDAEVEEMLAACVLEG